LAKLFPPERWFLATATAFDEEMLDRIERHKAERSSLFQTIEEPINIDTAVRSSMVVDCIPMWLNNLFFTQRESDWEPILDRFIVALALGYWYRKRLDGYSGDALGAAVELTELIVLLATCAVLRHPS